MIVLAVAAGIWFASQFPVSAWLAAMGVAVGLLAVIGAWRLGSSSESIWAAAFCMLVTFGALRYALSAPLPGVHSIARYNGQRVALEGVIVEEPDVRPTHTNLRVRPLRLLGAEQSSDQLEDLVLIRFVPHTHVVRWRYGDVVRASGLLDAPPRMSTFDYREYLARQGVFSWMPQPRELVRLGRSEDSPLYARLLEVKDAVRRTVQRMLPMPESALLNGILIGDDNAIPEDLKGDFRRTGTSHIVAISGFNVSIVIALVIPLLSRVLNARRAALFAMPAIAIYTVFVGGSASVVRAALMAGIGLFGALCWRKGFTLNTLCAAGLLMLVANPHTLFDVGFQLSFMATLGLVLHADRLSNPVRTWAQSRLGNEKARKALLLFLDGGLVTLAAQLTTLPLILVIYNQFSNVALLANVLILPLQPPIMILGALAAFVALLVPLPIASVVALPAHAFLAATIWVVRTLASLPGAAMPVYGFGTPAVLAYYFVLFTVGFFLLQPASTRRAVADLARSRIGTITALGIALVALLLGGVYWFQQPDGRLHMIFVGSSAIIQSPSGKQAVFVGSGDVASILGRFAPVWDREIELLILPQRSERHLRDALPLLHRYRIGTLIVPADADEQGDSLAEWQQAVESNVARVLTASLGASFALDTDVSLAIEIRAPGQDGRQAIGARLIHDAVVVDLVGDHRAVTYASQQTLIFLSPSKADSARLNDAGPRWVVWADSRGVPPRLDPHIRAINLKDTGEVAYVSDGSRLSLR